MKGYGIRQQTTGCSVVSGKVWESFQTVALGLPWWGGGSESTCQCWRHGFDSWSRKILHAAAQRHGPRLLKLACSRAPAHRRPWQWEAREPNYRGAPAPHRQKPVQQQRHSTTKTKIIKCSLKKKKMAGSAKCDGAPLVFGSSSVSQCAPHLHIPQPASTKRCLWASAPAFLPWIWAKFWVLGGFRVQGLLSMSWRTENPRCRVTSRRWHCGDSIISRHLTE